MICNWMTIHFSFIFLPLEIKVVNRRDTTNTIEKYANNMLRLGA